MVKFDKRFFQTVWVGIPVKPDEKVAKLATLQPHISRLSWNWARCCNFKNLLPMKSKMDDSGSKCKSSFGYHILLPFPAHSLPSSPPLPRSRLRSLGKLPQHVRGGARQPSDIKFRCICGWKVTWPTFRISGPVHIFGMVEDRNFTFGMQIDQ